LNLEAAELQQLILLHRKHHSFSEHARPLEAQQARLQNQAMHLLFNAIRAPMA
jgi:hypothetical protein